LRAPFQLGRYSPEIRAEGPYIFLMVAGKKTEPLNVFFISRFLLQDLDSFSRLA
jgi:hypothetical protein